MTRREKRLPCPPMSHEDIEDLAAKISDPYVRATFNANDWPIERNEHGFIIGPLRQCLSASGRLKKIYMSLEEAKELVPDRYSYECSFGHIHVATKLWTRAIFNPQEFDHSEDI